MQTAISVHNRNTRILSNNTRNNNIAVHNEQHNKHSWRIEKKKAKPREQKQKKTK